jgi:Spy/CpxP family protein refolding chaperone
MGCSLIRLASVWAIAATLAAGAMFAGTAAASTPHEGLWSGDGIHFRVVHEGSHTRVVDIHWHGGTSYGPDYVFNGEFSSCYSFSTAHFY